MPDTIYDYYSVDASVMIGLKDMGPSDIFRPVWDEISRLVSAGRWKIFENVADEIHDEAVQDWLAGNSSAIVKFNPEINEYMNKLMADSQKNSIMPNKPHEFEEQSRSVCNNACLISREARP